MGKAGGPTVRSPRFPRANSRDLTGRSIVATGATTKTVLIVDDDRNVVKLCRLYLERDGFQVISAYDGMRGLELSRESSPDLIVLDLMLPLMDGRDVCRAIREESAVPIIMLTAMVEEDDTLVGLGLGADDYVTKPFSPRELAARVQAVLRRTDRDPNVGPPVICSGGIRVDMARRAASIGGVEVKLTPTEFRLLALFASEPDRVFSRDQIIDRVLGYDFEGFDRTVDAHVSGLRRKMGTVPGGAKRIQTVYGSGYKLTDA